ncbi:hypothetical protein C1646_776505 [Rhizophagus diaphanus]|nr:hypothetical protein C1646_776505 [Rhizophagus diaphanus] [Rhizophagus sp. MUCL 43196]
MNPTQKNQATQRMLKQKVMMLCYQIAALYNKQVSGTKTAVGLLMVGSGTSKNGINTLANMGMSSTYQTTYNMLKKNADNHKSSVCTYINSHESLTEDGPKKTISDWVCITNALIVVNDEDTEEITRLKKYLYRVMLPLIESFLKPIPDIKFAGLDWRVMEVLVLASKYRKNQELDHSVYKVVEGKCADLLAWSWETGEEIFVGEQAGPPLNLT